MHNLMHPNAYFQSDKMACPDGRLGKLYFRAVEDQVLIL